MNNILILNFDSNNPHSHYANISKTDNDIRYWMINNATNYTNDIREFVDMQKSLGRNTQYIEYSHPIPDSRLFMDLFTLALNDLTISTLAYSHDSQDLAEEVNLGLDLMKDNKCIIFGRTVFKPAQSFEFKGKMVYPVSSVETPFMMNMHAFRQATRSIPLFNAVNKALEVSFPFDGKPNFPLFFSELNTVFAPLTNGQAPILGF